MLTLPSTVRVYVATQPTDLRKGFNGLSLAVTSVLDHDPLSGHLFCFFNRRATMVRILFWDRTGWCIISNQPSLVGVFGSLSWCAVRKRASRWMPPSCR